MARGATIHAEITGFATNSDGVHATKPEEDTMRTVMQLALQDAGLDPKAIGYINGHGTATEQGDIAESRATAAVFGSNVPMSTQKSDAEHPEHAEGGRYTTPGQEYTRDTRYITTRITADGREIEADVLILATGLSLASVAGVGAHPSAHAVVDSISLDGLQLHVVGRGPACASHDCRSERVGGCCPTVGAAGFGGLFFCIPAAALGVPLCLTAIDAPTPTPRLLGCATPVEQRPPATVA